MKTEIKQNIIRLSKRTKISTIQSHLVKNILLVIFSVLVAVLLAYNGIFERILAGAQEFKFIGSFIAGLFFTSILTTASATVALGEIAQESSVMTTALIGAAGAVLGDLILFKFLKSRVTDEFIYLFSRRRSERLAKIFHLKSFRWLLSFLGALVIASPLPDELGLALMGISTLKAKYLIPISFVFNFIGIVAIGIVARQIQ